MTLQHIKVWKALTRSIDPGKWVPALGAYENPLGAVWKTKATLLRASDLIDPGQGLV